MKTDGAKFHTDAKFHTLKWLVATQGFSVAAAAREVHVNERTARFWTLKKLPPSAWRRKACKKRVTPLRKKRKALALRLASTVVTEERVRFTPVRKKKVTRLVRRKPWNTPHRIARRINNGQLLGASVRVTPSTIRRDLLAGGMKSKRRRKTPPLTAEHRANRVTFARHCLATKPSIIFTDEKLFRLSECHSRREWVMADDEPDPLETVQGGESLWVWGAIGVDFFVFVTMERQSIDRKAYREQILSTVLPELKAATKGGRRVFQQDGAAAHAGGLEWLQSKGVSVLSVPWPAHSPDMSPIEMLWSSMARAVSEMGPFSAADLERFVNQWVETNVSNAVVNRYLEGFLDTCDKVIKAEGKVVQPGRKRKTSDA